jgi:hypothetical protein
MTTTETPAKVQRLLDIAAKYTELVSAEVDFQSSKTRTWEIQTNPEGPRAYDRDKIWIYWAPAANGGSVRVVKYYFNSASSHKVTQAQAGIALAILAGH